MALNNSQHNKILSIYDEKSYKRNQLINERKTEVYIKIRDYKKLEEAFTKASIEKAKLLLSNNSTKADKLSIQIDEITRQKATLLCDYGFGVDYFNPPYDCDICKDTGFVNNTPCQCFNRLASSLFCKETMSNEGYNKHSFKNFDYNLYSKDTIDPTLKISPYDNAKICVNKALDFVQTFSANYDNRERKNLFIYGGTGVGKTYLSNCIAKALIEEGYKVMYISSPSMFELMSDYAYNKEPDNYDIKLKLNKIKNDVLLILDDLGTEGSNSFTNSQLYNLLNDRLNRGLSTVITSNIMLRELKNKYDERIYSRIVGEYSMIKLIGEDLRIKK